MNREDVYSAVQSYLDEKKHNPENNKDIKLSIQNLVGKKISLKNIRIVGEK